MVPADPDRRAGEAVLDRLEPAGSPHVGPTVVVRDGAALLLRRGGVLVRVRPAGEGFAVAHREVRLARALGDLGVPVTPLVPGIDQPVVVGASVVTAWSWIAGDGGVTPRERGSLARRLREATASAAGSMPPFEPLEAILAAVGHVPGGDTEAQFVRRRADELATPYADAAADEPLGRALVHGDLHADNVVAGPDGPLLTDLELAGVGPPSYDAAPAVVAVDRYGAPPESLQAFLEGFGADPRPWGGFSAFVAVHELWVTAWAVGVGHLDPSWAREATRRVATLRDGVDHTWHLS